MHRISKYLAVLFAGFTTLVSCKEAKEVTLAAQDAPSPTFEKPRLVIQITVDQLRGDLPTRYIDRLGKGGLRYLLEEGIHYNNAHHAHANTETIVGHVTLATGAHPAAHGMIGNIWFDRTTGVTTYNIVGISFTAVSVVSTLGSLGANFSSRGKCASCVKGGQRGRSTDCLPQCGGDLDLKARYSVSKNGV